MFSYCKQIIPLVCDSETVMVIVCHSETEGGLSLTQCYRCVCVCVKQTSEAWWVCAGVKKIPAWKIERVKGN